MIEMQQMPAPVGEERDADGRLVAMRFEGGVARRSRIRQQLAGRRRWLGAFAARYG